MKVTLFYSVKLVKSNDHRFSRILYFKVVENDNVSIQTCLDFLVEVFLTEGFCKIQSKNTRYEGLKLESGLKTDPISLFKHLKGIYGVLNVFSDGTKGFQFDLYPSKSSTRKRFYVRGVPDTLQLFDSPSPNNEDLKNAITDIEKSFINTIKNSKGLTLKYVVLTPVEALGYDVVSAAVATRLYTFKNKNKSKKKFYSGGASIFR